MRKIFDQLISFVRKSDYADKTAEVIERELERIQGQIDELDAVKHIQGSSGDALDKHGRNLGLVRNPGESDDIFKQRLILEIKILGSEGTIDDIQNAFVESAWLDKFNAFNQEKTEVVEFHDIDEDAFFELRVDMNLIDGYFDGTFGFSDKNGNNQDSSIEGFNQGTLSGTTTPIPGSLLKDIVKRIRPAGVSTRILKEGEFGFANSEGEVDDETIEGFNSGRLSTLEFSLF